MTKKNLSKMKPDDWLTLADYLSAKPDREEKAKRFYPGRDFNKRARRIFGKLSHFEEVTA
jgi:hypothetical protein